MKINPSLHTRRPGQTCASLYNRMVFSLKECGGREKAERRERSRVIAALPEGEGMSGMDFIDLVNEMRIRDLKKVHIPRMNLKKVRIGRMSQKQYSSRVSRRYRVRHERISGW
ncbi:MAG TPA: hypothetical protein PK878_10610 [bacterium]|nr:hypothetical protein [bacterium]HOL95123.1 hypothetical protein [bacterium]HXK94172.1 hypothetical protein [bacterium]